MTTLLDMLPSLLLIAGGCALAVWAKNLKDEQSAVVSRLTSPKTTDDKAKSLQAVETPENDERGNLQRRSMAERPPSDAGAGNSG